MAVGFGTTYAPPAVSHGGTGGGVSILEYPGGVDVAVAIGNPSLIYISVHKFNPITGWGTKYAAPATLPYSDGESCAFSPDGLTLALGGGLGADGVHVSAYPWTPGVGFGARYADPGSPPSGLNVSVAWSPNGAALAFVSVSSPWVHVWKFTSGVGWGAKYANPSPALPVGTGQARGVLFSPDGATIFITYDATAGTAKAIVSAYQWSDITGFGTKYADFKIDLPGAHQSCKMAMNESGTVLFVPTSIASFPDRLMAVRFTPGVGFGTPYPDAVGIGVAPQSVKFRGTCASASKTVLLGLSQNNPQAWPWSDASGFGTKYDDAPNDTGPQSTFCRDIDAPRSFPPGRSYVIVAPISVNTHGAYRFQAPPIIDDRPRIPHITCSPASLVSSPSKSAGCSSGGLGWTPEYIGVSGAVPIGAEPTQGEALTAKRKLYLWAEMTHLNY